MSCDPLPAPPPAEHPPTADVMLIMTYLLEQGGWARSSEIARVSGVHRDTARRILRQLAAFAWVELQEQDGEARYCVGPELPRIGLAYLALLERQQAEIRSRFDAATVPHAWTPGPVGRPVWRPNPTATDGDLR